MRILSLGVPMPGAAVDNHSFANAPAFFDYDALVVDPAALSQLIEEIVDGSAEHATRSGERVINRAAQPGAVSLAALLRDRRTEAERLLARGGLVVCFALPNVAHERVAGIDCDRYCWLPAPPALQYDEPFLRRGDGSEIQPTDRDHPFGSFIDQLRGKLAYQAYFDDAAAGFAVAGRVIARSTGGAALAIELSVGAGCVIFLPPPARVPAGDERYVFSNALQEAVRQTLRLAAASSAPAWVQQYALPGLPERLTARAEAAGRRDAAQEALETADGVADELGRFQRLLWQEGRYGLEEPVRDALALLGFRVVPADIDQPAEAVLTGDRGDSQTALLEVDAAIEAVGMEGHFRLRRRLEEAIVQGKTKRGLLIINGFRTRPPAERERQYQEPLRVAAETLRYCVATTEQLFHGVRAALEGDEATVRSLRERLLTTEGIMRED